MDSSNTGIPTIVGLVSPTDERAGVDVCKQFAKYASPHAPLVIIDTTPGCVLSPDRIGRPEHAKSSFYTCIRPLFIGNASGVTESNLELEEAFGFDNVYCLHGDPRLDDFRSDFSLATSGEPTGNLALVQGVAGTVFRMAAERAKAPLVLVLLPSGASPMTQVLAMNCDIIIPCLVSSPDCQVRAEYMTQVAIPRWIKWHKVASRRQCQKRYTKYMRCFALKDHATQLVKPIVVSLSHADDETCLAPISPELVGEVFAVLAKTRPLGNQ